MQQMDDPPSLPVGTEVSAKYKGAFCEAKVSKVVPNIKIKVAYKQGLGTGMVSDDAIKCPPGQLRVGATLEVRHPDRKEYVEATVTKIQDCSQYTVVFDDGDITTLRRTALCLKSGRHFNESETLDQLPLTHPEHFLNPVVGSRRGRRRGQMTGDSSEEEYIPDPKARINEKEEHIGRVVFVETESKKKDKEKWFPALIVAPSAQTTHSVQGRIRVKDEYLVRSFKDGRYYTVPKNEAQDFTREAAEKQDSAAVKAALEYLDNNVLPPHWDRTTLFGLDKSSSEDDGEVDSDSSDDEPREEKDHFVAQLYKYMDDRGTPLNKVPVIQNRDVDLYRLFRAVQKRGGYNRVTAQNQWKSVAIRLGFSPVNSSIVNLVKQAFKKFLQPYGDFYRKLGCSMLMAPRNSSRSKGRSLVRASTVASPKPGDQKESTASSSATSSSVLSSAISKSILAVATSSASNTPSSAATQSSNSNLSVTAVAGHSATDESENTSESSVDTTKKRRKESISRERPKMLVEQEKFEEKSIKDEGDVPLAKIKAAAASRTEHKDKEKEKDTSPPVVKEPPPTPASSSGGGHSTRDSSPASSSKKEKHQQQRKPSGPSEDRRGKRKKGEVTVEKVDAGDFIIEVGDRLKVYYHEVKGVTYDAKVIEISIQNGTPMYFVHYTGWNNRYDEWVPRERIAENITKGSKHKGRSLSTEQKQKSENPPKPPSLAVLHAAQTANAAAAAAASMAGGGGPGGGPGGGGIGGKSGMGPSSAAAKRGRGRSDSNPPRSTTPSSVASNSSRTKSPAASILKRRPTRSIPSSKRRTSAAVSDISMATESDTDSDEPVRRPLRGAKVQNTTRKSTAKGKMSVSATNSQSESDDDEAGSGGPPMPSTRRRTISGSTASTAGPKGRDYDLNQIRSELKGFQGLKSPSSPSAADALSSDVFEFKPELGAHPTDVKVKEEPKTTLVKVEPKEEPVKSSSTDMSSGTDSFGDDDSQSSDKTTLLENMTKKLKQKINAEKQRGLEKHTTSGKAGTAERAKTRIVEKIINEKHLEGLKAASKVVSKEDVKSLKDNDVLAASSSVKAMDSLRKGSMATVDIKEEDKKSSMAPALGEAKYGVIAPARFGNVAASGSSTSGSVGGKFSSVIMEKPLSVGKKSEGSATQTSTGGVKKLEATKKSTDSSAIQTKKSNESALREMFKIETPAAGSPSSNSSSSSSGTSASTCGSSRSLPDMSKLDISGSSSMSSFASVGKETKFAGVSSSVSTATNVNKPISPDIYEFKDPEPFEFEMRKPTVTTASASATTASTSSSSSSSSVPTATSAPSSTMAGAAAITSQQSGVSRKQTAKSIADQPTATQSPLSALVNRKKRGSPMKESVQERTAKQHKNDEKPSSAIGPEAKSLAALGASAITGKASSGQGQGHGPIKPAGAALQPTLTGGVTPGGSSSMLAPPTPGGASYLTPQKLEPPQSSHTPFDVLRKSPSFNLSTMHALNEELARTVQETTRALPSSHEALQTPSTPPAPEVSKMELSTAGAPTGPAVTPKSASIVAVGASPKQMTPSKVGMTGAGKSIDSAGSPFIETRKDISNVFELSSSEGLSSSSESKDNNLELENVKKLLSSSSGGFDLMDTTKYENKPTSIADRVLKAISQKKEEVENKNKEGGGDKEKVEDAIAATVVAPAVFMPTATLATRLLPDVTGASVAAVGGVTSVGGVNVSASLLLTEPLRVNTELPSTSSPLLSAGGSKKDPFASLLVTPKLTPGLSPDPKLGGILEPKLAAKNSELNETIQKLECAIQRKTPVSCLSMSATPTSTAAPSNYSDDSMDSTDSERRLIIEDVVEEGTSETQKSSPVAAGQSNSGTPTSVGGETKSTAAPTAIGVPVKLDASMGKMKIGTTGTHHGVQAPIPLKMASAKAPVLGGGVGATTATATTFTGKLQGTAGGMLLTTTKAGAGQPLTTLAAGGQMQQQQQQQQIHAMIMPLKAQAGGYLLNVGLSTSTTADTLVSASKTTTTAALSQVSSRTSNVVPIVVPEIPASVVVAASAQPAVMAAAQAAATALQAAKSSTAPTKMPFGQQPPPQLQQQLHSLYHPPAMTPHLLHLQSGGHSQTTTQPPHGELGHTVAQRALESSPAGSRMPSTLFPYSQTASAAYMRQHASTLSSPAAYYMSTRPIDGVEPLAEASAIGVQNPATSEAAKESAEARKEDQSGGGTSGEGTAASAEAHNETINLLCEETIPGSPAPAFGGRDEPPLPTPPPPSSTAAHNRTQGGAPSHDLPFPPHANVSCSSLPGGGGLTPSSAVATHSSPNDSGTQEDSGEETAKKVTDMGSETSPRKRRRTRKQSEAMASANPSGEHPTKRRRGLANTGTKRTAAGSDSDENSDSISQRSGTSARHQQQQQQQQQQHHQLHQQLHHHQQQHQPNSTGIRPCPYNFLVELDPSLSPDQCISILLKQIQDLRKTYNMIKSELAVVERRRKKLRRREREKKQQQHQQQQQQQQLQHQQQQQQQQIKISS